MHSIRPTLPWMEGILYIRAEYPLTVKRVRQALANMEAAGLLGENILGSGCLS